MATGGERRFTSSVTNGAGVRDTMAGIGIPDPVSFDQFRMINCSNQVEPERALIFAILKDAIDSYMSDLPVTDRKKRKDFYDAKKWIFTEKEGDYIFSFENVCELLDLDPDYIRKGILAWTEKQKGDESKPTKIPRTRTRYVRIN